MKVLSIEIVESMMEIIYIDARFILDMVTLSGNETDIRIARNNLEAIDRRMVMLRECAFSPRELYFNETDTAKEAAS